MGRRHAAETQRSVNFLFLSFFLGFEHHFWNNVTLHVTAVNKYDILKLYRRGKKHFFAYTFLPESLEEVG